MKKIKKLLLPIFFLLLTFIITFSVLFKKDMDIRDEAASGDYNPDTYRGMARFGVGHLINTFTNNNEAKELLEYRFGWYHNWYHKKEWICGVGIPTTIDIPDSIDFYGFVGDWAPNETDCSQSFKDELSNYKDGDVIWIGNEIGWDDKRDPTTYARQYKSWYDCIKSVNPNIKVAPGANPGNPTWDYWVSHMDMWLEKEDPKGRWSVENEKQINYIEYLTYAKNDYKEIYGEEMPLDAYVIHIYGVEGWHDVDKIKNSIIAFRQYMKDEGHQRYHLYIKEMGMLPNAQDDWEKDGQTMVNLFNMLLNLKDENIGNLNDDNRLVQRWAWYVGPVGCTEDSSYESCTWKYTGFYHCHKLNDNPADWSCDCSKYRKETPLGKKYREYVSEIWPSYDSQPPDKPEITYELNGNTANVNFQANDNGQINDYEISVGSSEGKADVMLWTSTDTKISFNINNAVGKYVNVKALDDGYNWSEVSSVKIKESQSDFVGSESKADIVPSGGDGKVNMLDLALVLNNWKWKKENRDEVADVNDDEEVNMLDIALIANNWTKKY